MREFVITRWLLLALAALLVVSLAGCDPTRAAAAAAEQGAEQSNKQQQQQQQAKQVSQARQSGASAAASLIGTIGSMVPGLISNVAPLVLLFGLGALMMPALGMGAMGLLRESRRSANDQVLPNVALPSAFAQYARPLQTSPQDFYYFTKRSLPSLMSSVNVAGIAHGLQDLLERVARAIDNADKRYN